MRAGDLNRRVRIEARAGRRDARTGQPSDVWKELVTVWGNVRMIKGKESLLAAAEISRAAASIRIRYRTDVEAGMRAVVDGVTFRVEAVLPNVSTRDYTDLVCGTIASAS
ncbi:phage head closure protein [Paraburkholderia azotifigens]|uniref:phage head closure protein n=1 Tax=Paraburkholderia TaxID=1822464 RepID=UPI00197E9A87|nr:phage head closure protein [Paraburkholderia sp. Tr-20389]MBN3758162.1 phage head closure protein [Paraburkholderia sp. Tr-20389]